MSATGSATDALERALARARKRKKTRGHSALFLAIAAKAEVLAAAIKESREDWTWKGVGEELALEGIAGKDGKPFAGATVKSTFYRVRRAQAAAGQKVQFQDAPKIRRRVAKKPPRVRKTLELPPPLKPGEVAPGVRPVLSERGEVEAEPEQPRRKFRRTAARFIGEEDNGN